MFYPNFDLKSRQRNHLLLFITIEGRATNGATDFSGPDAKAVESVTRTSGGAYTIRLKSKSHHPIVLVSGTSSAQGVIINYNGTPTDQSIQVGAQLADGNLDANNAPFNVCLFVALGDLRF